MRWILRVLIGTVIIYSGYQYAAINWELGKQSLIIPALAFFFLLAIFWQENKGYSDHPLTYLGGYVGALAGLILGNIICKLAITFTADPNFFILINTLLAYLGYSIGSRKGLEYGVPLWSKEGFNPGGSDTLTADKVLDTSVIIDGRILDIAETGFLEGTLLVPQFVLNELQHIADSPDSLKRTRGRRGLDILKKLQSSPHARVQVTEEDFPGIKEVDSKLIALAVKEKCRILTNDFNLNKVAQIQGVEVLNINLLSDALKPIVLPGETMRLTISKPGKEKGQGVAYLDDGTMVVVENSDHLMNKTIETSVTSVLQTPAGRMIFASPKTNEC